MLVVSQESGNISCGLGLRVRDSIGMNIPDSPLTTRFFNSSYDAIRCVFTILSGVWDILRG